MAVTLRNTLPDGGTIDFPPDLPISEHADEIAEAIASHQVVVVAGETGSGKTTQLPKICLGLGRTRIAHTQPRRIAARTVAERVADEMDVELGNQVGYQVRFTRHTTSDTALTVMTDGVLLAQISHDRDLRAWDTIIIDEAHERSLNIDFLLGYLKQLLSRRDDLKVIITSATIDTARFSAHFDDAPIIEVSGRTYPVEVRYRPLETQPDDPDEPVEAIDQPTGICRAVTELSREGSGDILVFLAGEREIRDAADALADLALANTEILPLYARLSAAQQHRVFTAHQGRRIVLATNVAETSLTVPGIRYVIDPGTARISRYSSRTKVQRLPIEPISQASANQRAGRCGRVAPGICIRLYSEQDFQNRPEFTEPEILRTNLASVILQMAQARLGAINDFPFVETPDRSQINDGLRLLDELGALRSGHHDTPRLTRVGHQLAQIPIDPRMGRMILEGARRGCLREILIIVSALSIPDVRERPSDKRDEADGFHRRFTSEVALQTTLSAVDRSDDHRSGDWSTIRQRETAQAAVAATDAAGQPLRHTVHTGTRPVKPAQRANSRGKNHRDAGRDQHTQGQRTRGQHIRSGESTSPSQGIDDGGDIMSIVRLWHYLRHQRKAMGSSAFRRMCRAEYLSYLRIREWQDLHSQLKRIAKDLKLRRNDEPAEVEDILTALLSGLLSHIGLLKTSETRTSARRKGARPGPREYLGTRGSNFAINPGSVLAKHPPELVVAVELVETSRLWARNVAAIRPEWVEQVGSHLLKRSFSEPHWAASSASVVANERATLYGVPLWTDRRVNYGRIDAQVARQIFIQSALVERDWRARHDFLRNNDAVVAQAQELEDRSRQRGLMADDQALYDHYDRRIPSDIFSGSQFNAWWRRQDDKHLLDLTVDDLIEPGAVAVDQFPDTWQVGDLDLPVRYVFEPGSGHDGVTVQIPLPLLGQVPREPFTWQVPGLRQELATELVRGLPKQIRTQLVPAPDRARAALLWLADNGADHTKDFTCELARALTALTGVSIKDSDWHPENLSSHLRVGFEVLDGSGHRTAASKNVKKSQRPRTSQPRKMAHSEDLGQLQVDLAPKIAKTLTKAARTKQIHGATSWQFGAVPSHVDVRRAGVDAVGYPCLVDERDGVGTAVKETRTAADQSHGQGVVRLLMLCLPDPTKWVVAHMSNATKLSLADSPYPSVPDLLTDCRLKTVDSLARKHSDGIATIRDEKAFDSLALQVRQDQAERMAQVVEETSRILQSHAGARRALLSLPDGAARADMTSQLDDLVFCNFVSATPDPWFGYMSRWMDAVVVRAESLLLNPGRDATQMDEIDVLLGEYDELCAEQPAGRLPAQVEEVGFMIEELRVQYFAQRLRTHIPVSPKRIRQAIGQVRSQS